MLPGPPASLSFGLTILGLRGLSFSRALEILAIYLFFSFKINRKKNPLVIPSENTAVSIWRLSSPSLFL